MAYGEPNNPQPCVEDFKQHDITRLFRTTRKGYFVQDRPGNSYNYAHCLLGYDMRYGLNRQEMLEGTEPGPGGIIDLHTVKVGRMERNYHSMGKLLVVGAINEAENKGFEVVRTKLKLDSQHIGPILVELEQEDRIRDLSLALPPPEPRAWLSMSTEEVFNKGSIDRSIFDSIPSSQKARVNLLECAFRINQT